MSLIGINALTRRYGRRRGVESLSLSVQEGEIFGVLGPNGAGKTTTIRVLLGFLRPTAGTARIAGLDCWHNSHRIKQTVGYLPGDLRLYSWLNGRQALRLFGQMRRQDLSKHGGELAERFQLDLSVKVSRMSRGTRQKLGLILALAPKPRVVILDEPSSGLDPLMQDELRAVLREMAAAGHTIFFSSHTLSEVEQLCDRVAIVRDGELVIDESLQMLRARAGRHVTIRWENEAAARQSCPDFLEMQSRHSDTWSVIHTGPVQELVGWLNGEGVSDLTIEPPDLETLFRRYYKQPPLKKGTGSLAFDSKSEKMDGR